MSLFSNEAKRNTQSEQEGHTVWPSFKRQIVHGGVFAYVVVSWYSLTVKAYAYWGVPTLQMISALY